MPAGDGTGPMGQGPMTGRRAGYCAGYDAPGYAQPGPGWGRGLGFRRGWGRGRGFGHGWYYGPRPTWGPPAWGPPAYAAPPTPEQEIEVLRHQAQQLQDQLKAIERRIEELAPEA
jgi:hypothetical protein